LKAPRSRDLLVQEFKISASRPALVDGDASWKFSWFIASRWAIIHGGRLVESRQRVERQTDVPIIHSAASFSSFEAIASDIAA
jgi:hypothetical protein